MILDFAALGLQEKVSVVDDVGCFILQCLSHPVDKCRPTCSIGNRSGQQASTDTHALLIDDKWPSGGHVSDG